MRLPVLLMLLISVLSGQAIASVYYEYEMVADTTTLSLDDICNPISINASGDVAFIGDADPAFGFEGLYVGVPGGGSTRITPAGFEASGRTFGPGLQISDAASPLVLSRDRLGSDSFLRFWDSAGGFTIEDRSDTGQFDSTGFWPGTNGSNDATYSGFNATTSLVLPNGSLVGAANSFNTRPALADDGGVVVRIGTSGNETDPIVYYDASGTAMLVADSAAGWSSLGRSPGISADGTVVTWIGARGNGLGVFAAFVDDLPLGPEDSLPPGSASSQRVFRLAGENDGAEKNPDLGFDAARDEIFLTISTTDRDSRVGVERQQVVGGDGSVVIAFLADPSDASVENPALPGTSLLFSDQRGLWTVRADIQAQLLSPNQMVINPSGAMPVAQIGDSLPLVSGGSVMVTTLTELYDPVANVPLLGGSPRAQRRGDHQLAFRVMDGPDAIVIHALQTDSDEDGLYDHWERPGGGIDIDQDGTADLELSQLGSDVFKRDIFLELDWTNPRNNPADPLRVYSNEPAAGMTRRAVGHFDDAPALANGIVAGIELRIDAGTGADAAGREFTENFPTAFARGGDLVGQVGNPGAHLDFVFPGGPTLNTIPGVEARLFDSVKRSFFADQDKGARELAFHYLVLADFQRTYNDYSTDTTPDPTRIGRLSEDDVLGIPDGVLVKGEAFANDPSPLILSAASVPTATMLPLDTVGAGVTLTPGTVGSTDGLVGSVVFVLSGAGAGQQRKIVSNTIDTVMVDSAFTTTPEGPAGSNPSSVILVSAASGIGEVRYRDAPNNYGVPGNDLLLTLGGSAVKDGSLSTSFVHWRSLVHELGHNLGLRHCDDSSDALDCLNAPASYQSLMSYAHQTRRGTGVNSYSADDWSGLAAFFPTSLEFLGNYYRGGLGSGGVVVSRGDAVFALEPSESDFEAAEPLDRQNPSVEIMSPMDQDTISQGNSLVVSVTASDDDAIGELLVAFDADGDGSVDQPTEELEATFLGGTMYEATFNSVTGPDGMRDIKAFAFDASGNLASDMIVVSLPEPGSVLAFLIALPLVARLANRRRWGLGRK